MGSSSCHTLSWWGFHVAQGHEGSSGEPRAAGYSLGAPRIYGVPSLASAQGGPRGSWQNSMLRLPVDLDVGGPWFLYNLKPSCWAHVLSECVLDSPGTMGQA
uniref:Uncharacterized protein n=1 Tax=Theropithecus gelada TaxID=9565 RepID=A0A8D2FL74_THEGE